MPGHVCLCVVRVSCLCWLACGSLCVAGWAGWVSEDEVLEREPRRTKKPRSKQANTVWHSLKSKAKRLGRFGLWLARRCHNTDSSLVHDVGVCTLQLGHCEVSFPCYSSVLARRCAEDQQCSHGRSGHRMAVPLSVVGSFRTSILFVSGSAARQSIVLCHAGDIASVRGLPSSHPLHVCKRHGR